MKVLPNLCAATENLEHEDVLNRPSSSLLDHGIRIVVMDRFVVFSFDPIPGDARVGIRLDRDAPHQILHEYRMLESPLGHGFFIRAFQQAVQLRAGR